MDIWSELGIEPTSDRSAIRRAYARQLKLNRPDQDPAGFERLRHAYETALAALAVEGDPDFDDGDRPEASAPVTDVTFAAARGDIQIVAEPARRPQPPETPFVEREALREPRLENDEDAAADDDDGGPEDGNDEVEETGTELWEALERQDSTRAERLLGELLAHESMSDFESRWDLERWLLSALSAVPTPSVTFIRLAVDAFRWKDDATHVPAHYHDLVDGLLAELELAEHLEGLARASTRFRLSYLTDAPALAGFLLGAPSRRWLADYALLNETNFNALKAEWRELEIFGPDALARQLDPEQHAWWEANVEKKPRWFLRLAQMVHSFSIIPIAGIAIFCVAGLPPALTERITGSSLFLSFYVPYVSITLGVVSLTVAVTTTTSILLLRAGRRLHRLLEAPAAALGRATAGLRSPFARYAAWRDELGPTARRLIDLVALVLVACGFWVMFFALLWLEHT